MSSSPTVAASSTKRPLEEPSSPSGPTDQPDAKRPALDKLVKEESNADNFTSNEVTKQEATEDVKPVVKNEDAIVHNGAKDSHGDTVVPDAPATVAILETQPIQSTANTNGHSSASQQDETQWLHVRAVISTTEAATIIGKGGENVTMIRKMSGAKCTVSDYQRGAIERILTVSGLVDAVSKAFGLIVRTLNNEKLDETSTPQSRSYPMRLLIPNVLIGAIIGRNGQRIREIQEASNARLNASDGNLPQSGERSLVIMGVADAVHIAVYYVAQTLVEQLTEKYGGPAASNYASRRGDQPNLVPGGMIVQPYQPQAVGGHWAHPQQYRKHTDQAIRGPANPYGMPYMHNPNPQLAQQPHAQQAMQYGAGSPARGGQPFPSAHQAQQTMGAGFNPSHIAIGAQIAQQGGPPQPVQGMPGQVLQQIFIPNDMVGAIIGKGGAKINEIRQLSGSTIKINEPQDNSNERLVTISGSQEANQMALYMLYSRLESEKHRI